MMEIAHGAISMRVEKFLSSFTCIRYPFPPLAPLYPLPECLPITSALSSHAGYDHKTPSEKSSLEGMT